jgi:hypothetical protein
MPKNRVDLKHIDCTDNTHYVIFFSPLSAVPWIRIRTFSGLLDPYPDPKFICTVPDPPINKQKMKKLISTVL